jgi:hypothetical protein
MCVCFVLRKDLSASKVKRLAQHYQKFSIIVKKKQNVLFGWQAPWKRRILPFGDDWIERLGTGEISFLSGCPNRHGPNDGQSQTKK